MKIVFNVMIIFIAFWFMKTDWFGFKHVITQLFHDACGWIFKFEYQYGKFTGVDIWRGKMIIFSLFALMTTLDSISGKF